MALHSIDFNLYPTNWLNVKFSTEIYAYISLFHSSLLCFIFFFFFFFSFWRRDVLYCLLIHYTRHRKHQLWFSIFSCSHLLVLFAIMLHKTINYLIQIVSMSSNFPRLQKRMKWEEIWREMWKFISSILIYTLIRGNLWVFEHVIEEWRMGCWQFVRIFFVGGCSSCGVLSVQRVLPEPILFKNLLQWFSSCVLW